MNDILLNMNKQHITILVLLDLSRAFDTIDHDILLKKVSIKLGLNGTTLGWFRCYLYGRSQRVSVPGSVSQKFNLCYGVPQGSETWVMSRTASVHDLCKRIVWCCHKAPASCSLLRRRHAGIRLVLSHGAIWPGWWICRYLNTVLTTLGSRYLRQFTHERWLKQNFSWLVLWIAPLDLLGKRLLSESFWFSYPWILKLKFQTVKESERTCEILR